MKEDYDFRKIEKKWQEYWAEQKYGFSKDSSDKPKHYHLVEFPYPSGAGLHVGHCMGYGASDAYCRMKRLQGYNVMYPMGWDAFGLPTENYAIRNKIKPQKATEDNVATFKKQMQSLGYCFDWSREVNTTDPNYYKWTQWIFLQFYKHAIVDDKLVEVSDDDKTTPRLAFQAEMPVNWCPSCKTILANEEVVAGNCERCGTQASKRNQKQWMLRITSYADKLITGLETVDYLDKIKTQQINWIGKSVGANIRFQVKSRSGTVKDEEIEVFTTRADTLFGCTYVVLAPEHPLVEKLGHHIQNFDEVAKYVQKAKNKSDLERTDLAKDKSGVKLYGVYAVNPINNENVDIYVADYVLANYGTGAIMAVPAHDSRDWEFAKKHEIPIKEVIIPEFGEIKEGEEERHTIVAIVKRKSDGKFLMLDWPEFKWTVPVIGGIEENEEMFDTAEREVFEETGYKVKAIEKIGVTVKSHFFAPHKNVKRLRYGNFIYCELLDEKPEHVADEELKRHKAIWLTEKECLEKCTFPDNKIGFEWYFSGNYAFTDYGTMTNSGEFDGLTSKEGKDKITEKLKTIRAGDFSVNYKLRDWIFSRQHYWGEPIPVVHCDQCGVVPIPEDQLPVTLPNVENYEPTDTGESPLAKITDWVNTTCPKCAGYARRETDTMPNWAGSSWYFLRYCDSQNDKEFASHNSLKYWMPVDFYNGGMEHTTLHLLYSRFWHKFLFDLGVVPTPEPYAKRIAHGIILGPDGRKMSKSFGNVINPDDIASQFGADTLRSYIMFIGPYDQESAWSTAGVQGVHRFLKRVWKNQDLVNNKPDTKDLIVKINQSIVGITEDLENFRMNTVVSKLMELNNAIEKAGVISEESYKIFLTLLFVAAPHIASEIWYSLDSKKDISESVWPGPDKKYLIAEKIEIVIQINGKVRDKISVDAQISEEEMKKIALSSEKVTDIIKDRKILKTIVVPKKLVSIVV